MVSCFADAHTVADPGFTNKGARTRRREGCVWEGRPSPLGRSLGRGNFESQNSDFRCILDTIFTVHLFGL